MKKSLYVLAAIVLSSMMLACSSDDSDGNSKTIMLRNHTESGCKDVASFSNTSSSGYQKVKSQFDSKITERVSLKGNEKGTLYIFHENAIFPCEAEFTISVDVSESTIIVHEDAPPTIFLVKLNSPSLSMFQKVRSLSMRMHRQQQTAYAIMTSIQK